MAKNQVTRPRGIDNRGKEDNNDESKVIIHFLPIFKGQHLSHMHGCNYPENGIN